MCKECYDNTDLKEKINYIEELKNIDNTYEFKQWNSTSLSFLYLFLIDEEMTKYHHVIKNICTIIKNDQERILKKINDNSFDSAHPIFEEIIKLIE